jgi:hypothetical protein
MRTRFLLLPILLGLLSACSGAAYRDYHFTDPVEYYYFYPEGAGTAGPAPLFIALLGDKHSPLDCIELFQQFAKDRRYALLCPDLGGAQGLADPLQAERDLAAILSKLYSTNTFQNQFFLTGFGDGGSFALEYAGSTRKPSAVSAMSVGAYPENSRRRVRCRFSSWPDNKTQKGLRGEGDRARLAGPGCWWMSSRWRERPISLQGVRSFRLRTARPGLKSAMNRDRAARRRHRVVAEARITAAMKAGEFDRLPGTAPR